MVCQGQADDEGRAFAFFADGFNGAIVALNDGLADGQSHARALVLFATYNRSAHSLSSL